MSSYDISSFYDNRKGDIDVIDFLIENRDLSKLDKLSIDYILSLNREYQNDNNLKNILILMFISLNRGNVCLRLLKESIEARFNYINDKTKIDFETLIDDIHNKANNIDLKSIISSDIKNHSAMIYQDGYLYFSKYYLLERSIENILKQFINRDSIDIEPKTKIIIKSIIGEKLINDRKEYSLNREQKIAIILSILNSFMIISGGPGTGKTTIVAFLLRILFTIDNSLKSDDIALIAPTGSAAERIKSSIINTIDKFKINNSFTETIREKIDSITPSTIHKLLKYRAIENSFYYNSENKLNKKIAIVDEVSMIDLSLMDNLLSSLDNNTKIIFLGDKNQLPSINVGTIFFNLVGDDNNKYSKKMFELLKNDFKLNMDGVTVEDKQFSLLNRRVNLIKNNRSVGNIGEIASHIVNNESFEKVEALFTKLNELYWDFRDDSKDKHSNKNSFFIEVKDSDFNLKNKIETLLDCWFITIFSSNESNYFKVVEQLKKIDTIDLKNEDHTNIIDRLFEFISNYRILSTMRRGYAGTIFINDYLLKKFKEVSRNIGLLCYPIVITQNDYYNNLFNGDLGLVLESRLKKIVIFKKENNYKIFHKNLLSSYEESFATTVHKSQGNEYKNILFFIPNNREILSKEILYTAITRAKSKLFVAADMNNIKYGLSKKAERDNNIKL